MSGNINWFNNKKIGFFSHYLAAPQGLYYTEDHVGTEEWNRRVEAFDVEMLASQLKEINADYYAITIGQNSGYYCAPNAVYDEIVGISPSRCSRRDLIADLSKALESRGIDLMVYLPSGAPNCDKEAVEKLEWKWGCEALPNDFSGKIREERLAAFQRKWEKVIREWSERWGRGVKGWWIDGCYFSEQMYLFDDEPNFHSFATALRSGNPDAVLAFNTGTNNPFELQTEESDYTAGEVAELLPLSVEGRTEKEDISQRLHGKKLHILSYLGETWGSGEARMPFELAAEYTRFINTKGGVVTWDIPLEYNGTLSANWVEYLKNMTEKLVRE